MVKIDKKKFKKTTHIYCVCSGIAVAVWTTVNVNKALAITWDAIVNLVQSLISLIPTL